MALRHRPNAIIMDWEKNQAIDDTNVSFCLTRRQASALLGITEYLGWKPRWENLGATDWSELNDFKEDIQARLLDMDCTKFRQSPDDNCILQVSYDSGQTWDDWFNFGECVRNAVTTIVKPIVESEGDRIIQELLDKYDGTANSIDESLVYDGSDDDEWRDFALCAVTGILIRAFVDAEIARRSSGDDWWNDLGDKMVAAGVLLTFLPIPGSRFLAAGAAFLGSFIELAAPVWNTVNILALQDDDAVELVACNMYDNIRGSTPTQSAFQTSLDDVSFSPISNAALIANAVRPMLQELEAFLGFLDLWRNINEYSRGGFIDVCPCPDLGWTVEFLSANGQPPNVTIIQEVPKDAHVWDNGNKWYESFDTDGTGDSTAYISFEFDIAGTCDLEWITMDIDMDSSGSNTFSSGQEFMLYDDVDALLLDYTHSGFHQNNTPDTAIWEGSETGVKRLHLRNRIYEPDSSTDTELYNFKVQIHGTGTIPPEWSAYEV